MITSKGCWSPKELQTVRLAGGLTTAGGHLKQVEDQPTRAMTGAATAGNLAWLGLAPIMLNLDDARRQVTPQRLVTWPGLGSAKDASPTRACTGDPISLAWVLASFLYRTSQ